LLCSLEDFRLDLSDGIVCAAQIYLGGLNPKPQRDIRAIVIAVDQFDVATYPMSGFHRSANEIEVLFEPQGGIPVFPSPRVIGFAKEEATLAMQRAAPIQM
jgi:hypothetical protein